MSAVNTKIKYPCHLVNKIIVRTRYASYDLKFDEKEEYIDWKNYENPEFLISQTDKKEKDSKTNDRVRKSLHIDTLIELEHYDLSEYELLYFNDYFNEPINHIEWKNIIGVVFGTNFSQPIDGVEWGNIQSLVFLGRFEHSLSDVKWDNIKSLVFYNGIIEQSEDIEWGNIDRIIFCENCNGCIGNMISSRPRIVSYTITTPSTVITLEIYNKPMSHKSARK